ncbi:methyltransferase [Candidatus Fukatsuia symbiotica]|uniref:O-methyltransferase C-terminal domain-containing protein n=1 Tax=Candidatus Fukatsuia symbiotica TaxID=1878942 RepID=A0A2U8I5Z7_9GAMM|nr:methyltransferase [Candidatus Fukatsuia symbiotica]AWK14489.1 hypothetical protein CCS41_08405 [Candidatus Fukatsuia symbiotica]MEA9444778.1 methyltransferase [Candidatus Fukatsuia symbiotica]
MTIKEMVPPVYNNQPMVNIVMGLYIGPTVLIAHELGIFKYLAKYSREFQPIENIQKNIKKMDKEFESRPLKSILSVTQVAGLVKSDGHGYMLTDMALEYLNENSPHYFGHAFDFMWRTRKSFSIDGLMAAIMANKPQAKNAYELDLVKKEDIKDEENQIPELAEKAMHSLRLGADSSWVGKIILTPYHRLLDICNHTATGAISAVKRYPHLQACTYGFAEGCKNAIKEYGLEKKITVIDSAGKNISGKENPFYSVEADIHFYSNVLHNWAFTDIEQIIQHSYKSLVGDGIIIIHEMFWNQVSAAPSAAAGYNMLLQYWTEGQQLSIGYITTVLKDTGFKVLDPIPTWGDYSMVIGYRAKKPEIEKQ